MSAALDELLDRAQVRVAWHGPAGEPVTTITLDRPEARNAMTPVTWDALAAVGEAIPADTRVVLVRGEGPTFCAGLDLRMLAGGVPGVPPFAELVTGPDADATIARFQRGFTWAGDVDAVTVALVQGAAVGAGFQLALACDLVVAADDARFAMLEATRGLVPDLGGTAPLVRAVGYRRALELCLSGRFLDATEAVALGLVAKAVPRDGLDAAGTELAEAICGLSPGVAPATVRLLRAAAENTRAEQLAAERAAQLPLLRALLADGA